MRFGYGNSGSITLNQTTVPLVVREILVGEISIGGFLADENDEYKIGGMAREILLSLQDTEHFVLQYSQPIHFVQADLSEIGSLSHRAVEEDVESKVWQTGAIACHPTLPLHLWLEPHGSPVGKVLMTPLEYQGSLFRFEVQEDAGVRWLRAVDAKPSMPWRRDNPVIFSPARAS